MTDTIIDLPTVSNRHCLVFSENHDGSVVGRIGDLSTNGTFVNGSLIKQNHGQELKQDDIISISESGLFTFHYANSRKAHRFAQEYSLGEQLGKGQFATTYICTQRSSGALFAVKRFTKSSSTNLVSRPEWLQQEIGNSIALHHPNLISLQETFFDDEAVYFVMELARDGDLFNWIVSNEKATETEARKIFVQLFKAVKYMVSLWRFRSWRNWSQS
jgi:serine/threonine-protein kinase CHEK2